MQNKTQKENENNCVNELKNMRLTKENIDQLANLEGE